MLVSGRYVFVVSGPTLLSRQGTSIALVTATSGSSIPMGTSHPGGGRGDSEDSKSNASHAKITILIILFLVMILKFHVSFSRV